MSRPDFRINGHAMAFGSVTTGTLLTPALLRAYSEEAKRICILTPDIARETDAYLKGQQEYSDAGYEHEGDEDSWEGTGKIILEELTQHLESLAPKGVRFGSHEGDGADIGWWPLEEDE